jgi:hypothetical protein
MEKRVKAKLTSIVTRVNSQPPLYVYFGMYKMPKAIKPLISVRYVERKPSFFSSLVYSWLLAPLALVEMVAYSG